MAVLSQVRELVDGLSELTAQHLRLARLELAEDARFIGLRVGLIAALAPLILVGYGFLCTALALALGRVLAADLAFLAVGGANLLAGVGGIALVARQLGGRKVLNATQTELQETSALIVQAARK